MPADPSSSIPSGLTALGHADPLRPAETPHLLAYLATVTDPRARAGRRHRLVAILALAAAAVLAGARSIAAIAEWAADAPQPVRAALGTRRDPLTGRWVGPDRDHDPPDAGPPGCRGAGRRDRRVACRPRAAPASAGGRSRSTARRCAAPARDGRQAHLLAAMDHATRAVLAQRQVDGAPGEVPAFRPCWPTWTSPAWWSPPTRCTPTPTRPSSWWPASRRTTCSSSRPTSPRCWPAAPAWPGTASPCWTAPATAATAASSCAPSKPSRCTTSASRTPPRSSRSPARPATLAPDGGGP